MQVFQRTRKMLPALLCALALGLGLTQSAQAASLPADSRDSAHWSDRAAAPEAVLVSRGELDALNEASRRTRGTGLRDLRDWTETVFDGAARADALRQEAQDRAVQIYEEQGGRWDGDGNCYGDWYEAVEQFFRPMIENSFDSEATGEENERFVLCTTPTWLRNFPSRESILANGEGVGTDYQLRTAVSLGEPLVTKGESEDGRYYYAFSGTDSGWVSKQDVAVCEDRESWLEAWALEDAQRLVVYGDGVRTEPLEGESEGRSLRMGTVLKLAEMEEVQDRFTFDSARGEYVVWLPLRGEGGWYEPELAVVSRDESVCQGYLPLSSANLAAVALKQPSQVRRGRMAGALVDCTAYARAVYRCFGLELSRSAAGQSRQPLRQWSLKGLSREKKAALLKQLPVGALLTLGDRELIYLGHEDGEFYVISAALLREPGTDEWCATAVDTLSSLLPDEDALNRLTLAVVPYYKAQPDDLSGAKVTVKNAVYTGKPIKAGTVVSVGDQTLQQGVHYTLSYADNRKVGQATVTIRGMGNWKGKVRAQFTIRPAATELTQLRAGDGSFTARWERQSGTGYVLQYSTNEAFSDARTLRVKGKGSTSQTAEGLESETLYQVRVRTWVRRNGRNYYSAWSAPRSVRTA